MAKKRVPFAPLTGYIKLPVVTLIDNAMSMVRWSPTLDGEYGANYGGPQKALQLMKQITLDIRSVAQENYYNKAVTYINNFLDHLETMRYYNKKEYWGNHTPERLDYILIPFDMESYIEHAVVE